MEQNRLKSWALWVSLFGALWIILSTFGVTEVLGVDQSGWKQVFDAIGSILVIFGVVNNPTKKDTL